MAAGDRGSGVEDKENDDNTDVKSERANSYTLEILQIIKDAQQQHGLRHGDHQRYRQYCARRLRRIRKSLHFPQGTRNKVQPKKITEANLKDARFLWLPLFDAERAWAYAMQLKAEANTETRKKFHLLNKLRRAVYHAEHLATLCDSDRCDARTKLEAQAYRSWMRGTLEFELDHWTNAMEFFTSAKTIYEKLAGAFVDEVKDIYVQRCEEVSPNIRYCAYNIGDATAIDDLMQMRLKSGHADALTSRLDELIEKTRERQSATLSEVTWRGRTVPVKSEQVRVLLLSVQESTTQLAQTDSADNKLSIYESLLKELIDAQQALREELKDDPNFKAAIRGQPGDGRVANSVYLHSYLTYLRLSNTTERNLLMVESMKANLPGYRQDSNKKQARPQDIARLFDIIIQNLSEISNLPGLEDDSVLAEEIGVQVLGYKAFRCFYIAQTCASAKKWREAIALYDRVVEYAGKALKGFGGLKGDKAKQEVAALNALVQEVDGQKYSCQASSIMGQEDLVEQVATLSLADRKKRLEDRLDQYYEDPGLHGKRPNLTQFPPDFRPVPCKPLFFDVALSKVDFPSLEDKLEQRKQQGGLTGLVKGWLWGGKK